MLLAHFQLHLFLLHFLMNDFYQVIYFYYFPLFKNYENKVLQNSVPQILLIYIHKFPLSLLIVF